MEEDIEVLNNFIKYFYKNKEGGNKANLLVLGEEIKAIENVLNELEKQEDRITELEKALIDLDFKYRNKVEKKDKIIDAMVYYIMGLDIEEYICKHVKCDTNSGELDCYDCIKQYFENQVNKINK